MDKSLYELVNPGFTFKYIDKDYQVKKANIAKVILYQERLKELQKESIPGADLKIAAYCIYLVLKDYIPDLSEDSVLENTPGDLDILECLSTLGFMNPQQKELAKKMAGIVANQPNQ